MLTAEELKITEGERAALVEVLKMLEDKTLQQGKNLISFDMDTSIRQRDCGTVACIGGWTWIQMNHMNARDADETMVREYVNQPRDSPLRALFFPKEWHGDWSEDITPEIAAKGVRSFLEFGNPNWARLYQQWQDEKL